MKVKRRTVWLLTLLSLAAVISVFYVFDPNRNVELSTIFTDGTLEETSLSGLDQKTVTTTTSESHLFEDMRLEMSNERSQIKDQLTQKIASEQATAEEKNKAFNEMNALIKNESSEAMLEMLIESLGYSDALVRIDENKAQVTVLTDEISTKQANEIIYIVRSELEEVTNVMVSPSSEY